MKITFSEEAWSEYQSWVMQDKKTVKKINQLLQSIERDGAARGIGKPEPLRHDLSGMFSRRIDDGNRLVYHVESDRIVVEKCKGHYQDK